MGKDVESHFRINVFYSVTNAVLSYTGYPWYNFFKVYSKTKLLVVILGPVSVELVSVENMNILIC